MLQRFGLGRGQLPIATNLQNRKLENTSWRDLGLHIDYHKLAGKSFHRNEGLLVVVVVVRELPDEVVLL
jgi:hypothetical protein